MVQCVHFTCTVCMKRRFTFWGQIILQCAGVKVSWIRTLLFVFVQIFSKNGKFSSFTHFSNPVWLSFFREKKKVYIFINYWLLLYIMKVNRNCGCKALKWQEKLPYPYKIFQALVIIWSLDTQEPMSLGTSTIYVVLTVWLL